MKKKTTKRRSLRGQVRALARELFAVGIKAAEAKNGGIWRMRKWSELQPHIVAGHDAMAAYVLKKFKRLPL